MRAVDLALQDERRAAGATAAVVMLGCSALREGLRAECRGPLPSVPKRESERRSGVSCRRAMYVGRQQTTDPSSICFLRASYSRLPILPALYSRFSWSRSLLAVVLVRASYGAGQAAHPPTQHGYTGDKSDHVLATAGHGNHLVLCLVDIQDNNPALTNAAGAQSLAVKFTPSQ